MLCCVQVDPRVPMLILAVKWWAKRNHVYNAHLGLLSSYSWTLMVINYLQCAYLTFNSYSNECVEVLD